MNKRSFSRRSLLRLTNWSLIIVLFQFVGAGEIAFARDSIQELYKKIVNANVDYRVFGAVCEQVTKLKFIDRYPAPAYQVLTGIVYTNKSQTLGELDLIVIDNQNQDAIVIGEVKCWSDLGGGHNKAIRQLTRFENTMTSQRPVFMYLNENRSVTYDPENFRHSPHYITISQEGGESYGFDETIEYSLDEMKQLHNLVEKCQVNHQCL